MKRMWLLFAWLLVFTTTEAAVKLPALVGDNMVLQRNTEVKVWGTAAPEAKISASTSWNGRTYQTTADKSGNWTTLVSTPDAGGPYEITVSDGEPTVLKNVLIGEVWVCSGQSNMEMTLRGFPGQRVEGSNEAVAHAGKLKNLRLFTVKRAKSDTPRTDCTGAWKVCSPASAVDFSAVAFFFGRNLAEILEIPIGLISTSWSGSYIEAWMDAETLQGFKAPQDKFVSQTQMFNAMILPLVNYGIRGFIWYQGESNRVNYWDYPELMKRMVALWRDRWGGTPEQLPFYFVQIAPYVYPDGPTGPSSASLREQQLRAMREIPNTGMAVTLDVGDSTNIHPIDKQIVGERLSYWALGDTYGIEGISYRSPEYKSMSVEGDRVTVTFEYADRGGLWPWDREVEGFELAGPDKVFHPAEATVSKQGKRNAVVVRSDRVKNPVAVRYCFKNYTVGDLYNTMGLPVSSFRSDDWTEPFTK